LSFFDEGDEPTRVTRPARPRQPTAASRRPGGAPPDRQTMLVRQGVALGVGILVIILIVLGINGCLDSRAKRALKDYNRNVAAVVSDSNDNVSKPFFQLLGGGTRASNDLQVQVNQLRIAAEDDVRRVKGFDVPDEMKRAQLYVTLVLDLRLQALTKIAGKLPTATASGTSSQAATAAIDQVAGQMQSFLTSDVIYSQRVIPFITQALDSKGIGGQTIEPSQFLPSLAWLSPQTLATRLGRSLGRRPGGPIAPGLHGHGLTSVGVGALALQPLPAVNRIPAGAGLTFDVKFQNQGDNDETDVVVTVRISGAGKPITVPKTVNQTKAHSNAEVMIPLGTTPPIGQAVTIDVSISPVPGEKKTDNNRQSYAAIFSR
jgi:hypothetical protein